MVRRQFLRGNPAMPFKKTFKFVCLNGTWTRGMYLSTALSSFASNSKFQSEFSELPNELSKYKSRGRVCFLGLIFVMTQRRKKNLSSLIDGNARVDETRVAAWRASPERERCSANMNEKRDSCQKFPFHFHYLSKYNVDPYFVCDHSKQLCLKYK